MIRFANPGSDISSFIKIYVELYNALKDRHSFGLDDISKTLVEKNLATSCGYMGQEALSRSTRKDRSRDQLYNQSKMYSELFKMLGWLHPTPTSALTFQFTFLGAHIVEAQREPEDLFKECILGIAFPNSILNSAGSYVLRPFATILKTIHDLGGLICRDELIIGPLCLENDRDDGLYKSMLEEIQSVRGDVRRLESKLTDLSVKRKIAVNTMGNYTRFPLAVLKWTGWTTSERNSEIYKRSIPFLRMTDLGEKTYQYIVSCKDFRAKDLAQLPENIQAALMKLSFLDMLYRSGFNLDQVSDQLGEYRHILSSFLDNPNQAILFSPFQELDPELVQRIFPNNISSSKITKVNPNQELLTGNRSSLHYEVSTKVPLHAIKEKRSLSSIDKTVTKDLLDLYDRTRDASQCIELFAEEIRGFNKDKFYPLVASLFRIIGYDCAHSRAGVNYERWDAIIIGQTDTIPIEIKSPGEEEFISVKAVRQALENKIILLSRNSFPTILETTSLVVGYNLPNDRSEVMALISNIRKAYGIVIGVIDIRSLLRLVTATLFEGKSHNKNDIFNLYGIIDVSDI